MLTRVPGGPLVVADVLASRDDGDSTMLRSGSRCFKLISRSLPKVLVCSAALGIAGCGGRFLDSSRLLGRSGPDASPDDAPGTATLDDADDASASPARRFISSLFDRDSRKESTGWDRDPFQDTPVFDREDAATEAAGVAQISDDRAPRTAVDPQGATPTRVAANAVARAAAAPGVAQTNTARRTIVRPARRASIASTETREPSVPRPSHPLNARPQSASRVADSQLAATNARRPGTQMRPDDLPDWARETAPAQARPQVEAVVANNADTVGRARVSEANTTPSPKPDAAQAAAVAAARREIEALLAASRARGRQAEENPVQRPTAPTVATASPTVATRSLPPRREFLPRNAPVVAAAPERKPSVEAVEVVTRSEAPVWDRPVETGRTVATNTITEPIVAQNDPTPRFTMSRTAVEPLPTSQEPVWSEAEEVGFPAISTWREVRANSPMSLANADAGSDGWIQQTNFSAIPSQFGELTNSVGQADAGGEAGDLATAPLPPLDVNSPIRAGQTPTTGSAAPVLSWGWLILTLGLTGIGIFAYRKRLHS